MHDMDFFISEARTAEFAARIADLGLRWWGLGRVDILMQYSDATWDAMARSGLKMSLLGRPSPAPMAALAQMNKGGKSSAAAHAGAGAADAELRHRSGILVRARLSAGSPR